MKIITTCIICNKQFKFYERHDKPNRKFCSNFCKFKYQKMYPPVPKSGNFKLCEHCKIKFYTQKNQSTYRFCSPNCSNTHKRGKSLEKKKTGKVIECTNCNEKIYIQHYRIQTFRFCSNKCRAEFKFKHDNIGLPNYNPKACKIIDEYGKANGYNFQHAMNGGEYHIKELGYYVDGYDKKNNVVIEIDEPHHYINEKLRKHDIVRQENIENFLNCKFIRIEEEKWENHS